MCIPELGKIEQVDIRDIWPDEARCFTPWLAENLDLLGKALKMDLEPVEQEAPVGPCRLDILAKDGAGQTVVIENQLEQTDHDHMGKLLTYAAGYRARIVIWVAPQFRDAHQQAIAWLNDLTRKQVDFCCVEVRVIKIDDSRPAPEFRLIAHTNTCLKEIKIPNSNNKKWRQFFQPLVGRLREKRLIQYTQARNEWNPIPSDYPGINYYPWISGRGAKPVEVYLEIRTANQEKNERIFSSLELDKEDIEAELGTELEWKRSTVQILLNGEEASLDDPTEKLDEIRDWMFKHLLKLKQVFDPRLEQIMSQSPPEEA